ncbi:MAG: hypothetical protein QW392_03155 [Candidatus Jordarchaeales archaeon]
MKAAFLATAEPDKAMKRAGIDVKIRVRFGAFRVRLRPIRTDEAVNIAPVVTDGGTSPGSELRVVSNHIRVKG